MSTDIKKLNISGRIPKLVDKNGVEAFEVVLAKNKIHPKGSNVNMTMSPKLFPCEECRVKFKLCFDTDFPWNDSATHKVGGKLGGFQMGKGNAAASKYSTTGASYRLTFKKDWQAVGYFYPQLRKDFEGTDAPWSLLDQHQEFQDVSFVAAGVHVFAPNRKATLHFAKGWNEIEMYTKLNTPGKYDGIMELCVNGKRVRCNTVRYRYTSDVKINGFNIGAFFGGSTDMYAPSSDINLWYGDFEFSS